MDRQSFYKRINTPFLMKLYLFWKLPAAWFMGISVVSVDHRQSVVRLPYGWRSQNPFRSTYFAAQCAAGELSTGLLALGVLQGQPPVSMLVSGIEAHFFKKASETLHFTCTQGETVRAVIEEAIRSGEGQTLRMCSVATLPDGTEAAQVWITWSFKKKRKINLR